MGTSAGGEWEGARSRRNQWEARAPAPVGARGASGRSRTRRGKGAPSLVLDSAPQQGCARSRVPAEASTQHLVPPARVLVRESAPLRLLLRRWRQTVGRECEAGLVPIPGPSSPKGVICWGAVANCYSLLFSSTIVCFHLPPRPRFCVSPWVRKDTLLPPSSLVICPFLNRRRLGLGLLACLGDALVPPNLRPRALYGGLGRMISAAAEVWIRRRLCGPGSEPKGVEGVCSPSP